MSSKGQHVQDNSVAERRLRPIYDWLDLGNNKKALQECDKVLKKTPGLQCAKALKALTLHRMGKEGDAVSILDSLTAEKPTDDATLQAITLCYRELQQLEKICAVYEMAVKIDPTNEELFTHLFMSYARIFDFKAQQKTAMALYKSKPKTPYYCWAVMSIILQATRGDGKSDLNKRKLLLSLAERMMEKLIVEGKLEAEQEVQLYIMVYELQQKFQEVLAVVDGPLGTKLTCSNDPQSRLKYLIALQMWDEINIVCKSILVDSVDRWDIWKEYINSVFRLISTKTNQETNNHENHDGAENDLEMADDTPEKCHEFICRIVENGTDNRFLLRGPYLARFELCAQLVKHKIDPADVLGEIIELFVEYFRKFGHKPWCVADLRSYLNLLDEERKSELARRLVEDVGVTTKNMPNSEQQMQGHLCALQLARLCGVHRKLPPEELRTLVNSLSLFYQHGVETFGKNLLPTDLGPHDPYVLLAAHVMHDLALAEGRSEPIIAALVLLDTLLRSSPSNFHAKLLCVRLYHTLGATLGAQNVYSSLDTKHLQLDSLGFVHCARLATTGLFSLCSNLYDTTLKFFSSNYKDSSDHITFSYKYGSFTKLEEFMDFRERLNNSVHYTTVAIDRIVLTLVECANMDALYNIDISPKDDKIDWDSLIDNHDLSVYISWDPERINCAPEELEEIKEFFKHNLIFLKLRTSVLWCLSAAVDIVKSSDGVREKYGERLKSILKDWQTLCLASRDQNYTPLRQNQVTLPLPSRLHVALALPHYEVIGNSFNVLLNLALENNFTDDEPVKKVESSLGEMVKVIVNRCENQTTLTDRRETLEHIVNSVEIVSLSCLVCLLCNDLVKPSQGKKGKKKVSQQESSAGKEIVNQLADVLKAHINQLIQVIEASSNFSVLSDLSKMMESIKLNYDGHTVCDNITSSYLCASQEIQTVLKLKLKMLNSL